MNVRKPRDFGFHRSGGMIVQESNTAVVFLALGADDWSSELIHANPTQMNESIHPAEIAFLLDDAELNQKVWRT